MKQIMSFVLFLKTPTLLSQVGNVANSNVAITTASPITYSYTLPAGGGSQRLLVFLISLEFNNTTNSITGLSYGGVAATSITSTNIDGGGKRNIVHAFRMNETQIAAATNTTVTISTSGAYAGSPSESMGVAMFMLGNVNQATPVEGAVVANVASGTTISTANINADNNDLIMYLTLSSGSATTWTQGAGFTERFDVPSVNHSYEVATQLRTSNGVSMPSATNSTANRLQMLAFEINVGSAPLPIELLSFEVKAINNEAHIEWISLSEKNNAFCTIEHSTNGLNWEEVSKVKGAGNSFEKLKYLAVDKHPEIGLNYYRLKQTDYDGKFEYFDIKLLEIKFLETELKVFPNPANEVLSVESLSMPINTEILMYDIAGKVVWSELLLNSNYKNSFKINVKQFPKGFYTLSIKSPFQAYQNKQILIHHD
jgi:Secretion system C-terminal sorting domain